MRKRKKKNGVKDERKDVKTKYEKKIYEIKTLEDYFYIVRDIFNEFREFIADTNDILNTALKAVRDMVPMLIDGKTDYDKVFQIIESVNSALRGYIDRQNKLINKITSASDILSRDINWSSIILGMIEGEKDMEREAMPKRSEDTVIPSFSIRDKGDKIIEEVFGIKPLSSGETESESDDKATEK